MSLCSCDVESQDFQRFNSNVLLKVFFFNGFMRFPVDISMGRR